MAFVIPTFTGRKHVIHRHLEAWNNTLSGSNSLAEMGQSPNMASFSIGRAGMGSLPPELVLQIIEYPILTDRDKASLAATCRSLRELVYPILYRRFDWVTPFHLKSGLGHWVSGFGILIELLLDPLVQSLVTVFDFDPPDVKLKAFEKRSKLVREMTVLGGYEYFKEMGILTRCYGPKDNGDAYIKLFKSFDNLTAIELDDRGALSWSGYLRAVASILVSKPKLEDLTLRHRLGVYPIDDLKVDVGQIEKIKSKGVVAKPKSLTIILGRRFEPSEIDYRQFNQLIEVLHGATDEVKMFKLFAGYSKLDEYDFSFAVDECGESEKAVPKYWSFPNLTELEFHADNFPSKTSIQSIRPEGLEKTKKLKIVCDVLKTDIFVLARNLSAFKNIEELNIWDPQWGNLDYDNDETLETACQHLSTLKSDLQNLRTIKWELGYEVCTTSITLNLGHRSEKCVPSITRTLHPRSTEWGRKTLLSRLNYIKDGYILANASK
ncbi:hypothetical protein TWF694_008976 [Orbilia ellipsospora]|uniref:F-box domain-containing protein n=1 Tax=Orbilia ellipsospora TaxID=2528407 RepID=A0AAV9XDH6_9PEZI